MDRVCTVPYAHNARRAADVLESYASEAADASALERPPLAEDPSLYAFLNELDRLMLRTPARVAAAVNQPRLIERLVIPTGQPMRTSARVVVRIERSDRTAHIGTWLAATGVVLAISFGAMTACLIFHNEVTTIAAEWTARR